jgi:hypothetical protein
VWGTEDLWLRRQIVLSKHDLRKLALRVCNEAEIEIYLNGVLAVRLAGRNADYEELDLQPAAERALSTGTNWLAVHCRQKKPGHYIDVGLAKEQEK